MDRILLTALFIYSATCITAAGSITDPVRLVGIGINGDLHDVDIATGGASGTRSTGTRSVAGITFDRSSQMLLGLTTLVGTPTNSLVEIDVATGASTLIGNTRIERVFEGGLAYDPLAGGLVGIADGSNGSSSSALMFRIDPATGAASFLAAIPLHSDWSGIDFTPDGRLFAVDSAGLLNGSLLRLDRITGSILETKPLDIFLGSTAGLAFHPTTGVAYLADGNSNGTDNLYSLDTATGVTTLIGPTGLDNGLAGLAFVIVPEPSAAVLTLAVLVMVASGSRRRMIRL